MKRNTSLYSTLLLLILPQSAWAVDGSVWGELAKVRSLQAGFVQVQHRAILKVPLESRGTVEFHRPDSLHWQVLSPSRSTFTLEQKVAHMEYPDLHLSETIDLAAVPEADRLATSLMIWLQADASAVARDFETTYGEMEATLVPKDPQLKALVVSLQLRFAAGPWRVKEVEMVEPNGDRVDIRFQQVVLDGVAVADPR